MNTRRMRGVVIAGLLSLLLAAYRVGDTGHTAIAETPPSIASRYDQVDPSSQVIVFWHTYTRERQSALDEIIRQFNQANEWGITVEGKNQGSFGDLFGKMMKVLNTAAAPDLVVAYQGQAAAYQVSGGLVDLRSLAASEKYGIGASDQQDFITSIYWQDIYPNLGGQRLGFPLDRSAEVMYVNIGWLRELGHASPPETPEEFKEMACKSAGNGRLGYELSLDASHFASWTFAFGGDVYDYNLGEFSLNNQAAVDAMGFLQGLFVAGCATYPAETYRDQDDFVSDKLLFYTASTSSLPFVQRGVDEESGFEWSLASYPSVLEQAPVNITGVSASIPKTIPERELAAWLFIQYMTQPEINARWAVAGNSFPVRSASAASLNTSFRENPAYALGFKSLENGKFEPPAPGYDLIGAKIAEAMAVIMDGADVRPVLDHLNRVANAILSERLKAYQE